MRNNYAPRYVLDMIGNSLAEALIDVWCLGRSMKDFRHHSLSTEHQMHLRLCLTLQNEIN